jgi:SAM-dependent methyltransferase
MDYKLSKTMSVDYDHKANLHTVIGPRIALPLILDGKFPHSVLDVGCGMGTWLNAFREFGVQDYFGLDGVNISNKNLLIDRVRFRVVDFSKPWTLGRKFDLAICLEVAEHLPPASSQDFVKALCEHSDHIIFSAGCPGQPGQNHINCEWPEFWQKLFNQNGFVCEDDIRPKIWNVQGIEVWYRQNLFSARRSANAGQEKRIAGMVHAEFLPSFINVAAKTASEKTRDEIVMGGLRLIEYPKMTVRAFVNRIKKRIAK